MNATLSAPPPNLAAAAPPRTVAELLERLGGIPAERILLDPPPGTATEADLLRLNDGRERTCELIDGILVEKPVGLWEEKLGDWLLYLLLEYELERQSGYAFGGRTPFRTVPGRTRLPDVSFVSHERFEETQRTHSRIGLVAPDLAVEVASASNRPGEFARKRREYFAGGTRLVWEIDPPTRTARVHADPASPDAFTLLGPDGTLDGAGVLPGFTATLAELFVKLPADAFDPPLEDSP